LAAGLGDKFRVRNVTRREALVFLENARESARAVTAALAREDWHVASQEAILGTISANDALLGLKHGIVSESLNHRDAVGLLRERVTSEEGKKHSALFTRMLNKKKLVMYEGRSIGGPEARLIAADAKTFLAWVEEETKDL
jgi:hypothetical protein